MAQNKRPELNSLLSKRYKRFHKETKQDSTFFAETQLPGLWTTKYALGWISLAILKAWNFYKLL